MIDTVIVGPLSTCCYIVSGDLDPSKALVIDPGDDAPRILSALGSRKIAAVLLTHGHFDHTGALSAFPDAAVYLGRKDLAMLNDPALNVGGMAGDRRPRTAVPTPLDGGEELRFDGFSAPVQVIAVPGHTPGGMAFLMGDALFSGDTLFRRGCGRTDFPGGSEKELRMSLRRLLSIPGDPKVYPGHMGVTALSEERRFWNYGGVE